MFQLFNPHDFGDNGKASFLLGNTEQAKAFGAQTLEGVGGTSRLKGTATEQGSTAGLDAFCHFHDLLFSFHRARTGNQGQDAAAQLGIVADFDDGVFRVEFPVGIFIRLLDPLDIVNNVQGGDEGHVQTSGITNQAPNGLANTFHRVDGNMSFF